MIRDAEKQVILELRRWGQVFHDFLFFLKNEKVY